MMIGVRRSNIPRRVYSSNRRLDRSAEVTDVGQRRRSGMSKNDRKVGRPDVSPDGRPTPFGEERSAFVAPERAPFIQRLLPVTGHLRGYVRRFLRPDALAGLTVAALAIPSGMAYAELAGLPAVVGLYALLLPVVGYALVGSSRQLVIGPEASISLLVGVAIAPMADGDPSRYAALAAMLALLIGAVYLIAFVARLGWIADYFSRPVLVGYIHGVVVVLIASQLGKLFGLSISAAEPIAKIVEVVREIGQTSLSTLATSVTAIASLLVIRRFVPRLPGSLIVVIGGIVASALFGLADHGVATAGDIPSGLPHLAFPSVGLDDLAVLAPTAVGLFCVGYADAVLTARSFAGRHGQNVRANQELLAMGVANAAAGISQAFPIGASGSRTAVNDQSGGRTQVVGLIAALTVAVVLLFLTAPVEFLPNAVLGAVIVVAALGLIDLDAWRAIAAAGRAEVGIAAVTMFGVVVLGVLWGLGIAVAITIVHASARSSRPHDAVLGWVPRLGRYADASTHRSARLTPAVVVYRLDDRLFFANADYARGRMLEAIDGATTRTRWLVLDAEGIPSIDATGIGMLELLIKQLGDDGIGIAIARAKKPLVDSLERAGLVDRIGPSNFHPNVETAVDECSKRLRIE